MGQLPWLMLAWTGMLWALLQAGTLNSQDETVFSAVDGYELLLHEGAP